MKKFLISTVLSLSLVGLIGITASAASIFHTTGRTKNLLGYDNWNRGIYSGNNGYYMSFSYYYNSANIHQAGAYLDGDLSISRLGGIGETICVNSVSRPSYNDGRASANVGRTFVRDSGSGEYVSSYF